MNWWPWIALNSIGILKVHAEEAACQPIPEGRTARFVDDAAQLGQDAVGKARAVRADEQVAAAREQQPEPAGALAGVEEQAADLARALEVGGERQHLGAKGAAELAAVLGQRAEPVAVERVLLADVGEHLAGAADLAGVGVLQHEARTVRRRAYRRRARRRPGCAPAWRPARGGRAGRLVKPPPVSLAMS